MRFSLVFAAAIVAACTAVSPCLQAPQPDSGVNRALLIGINLYEPPGTKAQHPAGCTAGRCSLPQFANLNGPINDVAAMRDLLASPKFGFDPRNIVTLTNPGLPASSVQYVNLPASQTSHDGLLAAMRKYLVDIPQRGDTVVFYYAGHGSLRVNSKGDKLAMMVDGKPSHADSTLVPSDAWTGNYDIRDREMTAIFNAALDKGVKLTVLLDSCHSGSFTRGVELGPQYAERSIEYDPRDIDEEPATAPYPSQRKDNPALILSAAQQDETAKERIFGDTPSTTTAHGAFTVALIKSLETLPVDAPAEAVYRQVRATLEGEGVGDQTPDLDALHDRAMQPLFGGAKNDSGKTRAAVLGSDDDGVVLLDVGQLAGIDAGSEFVSESVDSQGRHTKLRVESLDGLTHSLAKVVTPIKAKVVTGELFDLSKWIPTQINTLHVWTWPANLTAAQLQSAVTSVRAAGIVSIADPVEQPWTDMLAWNGSAWELRHAARTIDVPLGPTLSAGAVLNAKPGAELCVGSDLAVDQKQALSSIPGLTIKPNTDIRECHVFLMKQSDDTWILRRTEEAHVASLGVSLTPDRLKQSLAPDAKLWVNLPPPQELSAKLSLHDENSLVAGAVDLSQADYLLAGSLSDDGPQWAWFHKAEYLSGPPAQVTRDHSPGCSVNSSYPVSSDWVVAQDVSAIADAADALNRFSERLAKVNGWINIAGDLSGVSSADYYKLIFEHLDDQSLLQEGIAAKQGDRLRMVLSAEDKPRASDAVLRNIVQERWVYILDIDCHGKGTLLYPLNNSDNRFPTKADTPPREFALPGAPTLRIGPPYGVDTVLLISTQEPLPDPYALNFDGVSQRGGAARGGSNPLQQLLSNTSGGTRGPIPEMPTDWSIDSLELRSIPMK